MIQLVAIALCGYLGWQRQQFTRWPLSIIIFAAIAGIALVIAGHHEGFGPPLDAKLSGATVSLIFFPLAAYWLAYFVSGALQHRRRS